MFIQTPALFLLVFKQFFWLKDFEQCQSNILTRNFPSGCLLSASLCWEIQDKYTIIAIESLDHINNSNQSQILCGCWDYKQSKHNFVEQRNTQESDMWQLPLNIKQGLSVEGQNYFVLHHKPTGPSPGLPLNYSRHANVIGGGKAKAFFQNPMVPSSFLT